MPSWDEEFSKPGHRYGTEPNGFLVEMAGRLPPGARVIAAGDGEGRNGVWLAGQGHQVLALDASAVGLGKARAVVNALSDLVGDKDWLAGTAPSLAEFHAAPMFGLFEEAPEGAELIAAYPAIKAWWGRMKTRPSYRAALS